MKKIIFALFLLSQVSFSQHKSNVESYSFGQNGMEIIAKSKQSIVIVSTYNAKMTIREEIARKIYSMYAENKLEDNKKYTIAGNEANVTGNCIIRKKNNLIAIDFYYEKVEWYSGLVEIYKKFIG
ncbi:MAG TPA: hypothetical protein PK218_10940 [Flavobacterium sp.]|jgi:hypothetical protein|uniref:hypothetical protein n=1 Tax=Flavobacterium sp. TaxID=239 RepID=UPI002D03C06A|nr:hypothetical protein [Flavobacterium sp.]MCA0350229.1 hypothetical protein [Bacteroidota bacterium]HPW99069.1 hypothetical protein [Flavobacterium sp.]HQA75374.1 hypothetical protein [Flavobacterium sp.]